MAFVMMRLKLLYTITSFIKICFGAIYTNEFVFKLKDGYNIEKTAKLIAETDGHCSYLGKVGNVPNFYRMYCSPETKKYGALFQNDTFLWKMQSNYQILLLERQKLQYRVTRSLDPQWPNMWYINGAITPSMNIENAWNKGKTGKNVVVGVVDDGIYMSHTDLVANIDATNSYDYYAGDADANPSTRDFSHGTKVSGLLAAEADNNECTIGVAYNSTLIGIRLLGSTSTTDSKEASSLSHNMTTIDIYVNSWGPSDGFGFEGPGSATLSALQNGVNQGRGGKGSIYVWAAGNGGTKDNCNGDGYASSRYVITISALNSSAVAASYAEVCSTVLASTYSGEGANRLISTIVPSGCSSDLQGTSYAVPLAAGIIALTLEANPTLTWRDIQHLIVYTSKRYTISDGFSAWQKNGAQKYVSQVLGFGLMDADAMVTEAISWVNVPSQVSCNGTTKSTALYLQTVWLKTSSFLSGCAIQYLETVSVEISLSYSRYRGLILLTLISPSGTESQILTRRPSDAAITLTSGTLSWTFNSVHFWGEDANGNWTLRFQKTTASMTASITSWKLKLYGTTTDPLTGIDQCSSVPCKNNGTCVDKNYGYICICSSAYTGDFCDFLNTTSGQLVRRTNENDDNDYIIAFSVIGGVVFVFVPLSVLLYCLRVRIKRIFPQSLEMKEKDIIKNLIETFIKRNKQCKWISLINTCETKLVLSLQNYAVDKMNIMLNTIPPFCKHQKSAEQIRKDNWDEKGLDQLFHIIIPEDTTSVRLDVEYMPALLKVTTMYLDFAFQGDKKDMLIWKNTELILKKHLQRIEKLKVQTLIKTLKTSGDLKENHFSLWKQLEKILNDVVKETFEKHWKNGTSDTQYLWEQNKPSYDNVLSNLHNLLCSESSLLSFLREHNYANFSNISDEDLETNFKPIFLNISKFYGKYKDAALR